MLHTKPQGHWPFGSREDFLRVFTIYGHGGHLDHVTQMPWINFPSPDPWRLYMKFGFNWPSSFGEDDLWKWWTDEQRTDDGACLYYKLTNEPKGSGELKIFFFFCGILLLKGDKNFHSEYYRSLAVTMINNKCSAVIGYYLIDRLGFRLWTMN